MKSLAQSIRTLAEQFDRLQKILSSDVLCQAIDEFSSIMGEVISFIQEWLEKWTCMYEFL